MSQKIPDVIIESNVPATMRDGAVLRADIYRPAVAGTFPVLLLRTPYAKSNMSLVFQTTMDPIKAAQAGYMVIIQDVRSRWESDGDKFFPYRDEFDDGFDTVEWAASLPNSNGNVGMFGYSYYATTPWFAAVTQPPHLKAIFPFAAAMDFYQYRGGALDLSIMIAWTLLLLGPDGITKAKAGSPELIPELMSLFANIDRIEQVFRALPFQDIEAMKLGDTFAPYFYETLAHPLYDDYHKQQTVIDKHDRVRVPALIFTGWYDLLLQNDLLHFTRMRNEAATPEARDNTRIVIGPWTHVGTTGAVGELNFGLGASTLLLELKTNLTEVHLEWFDYWLKGIRNNINDEPPVKIFVMGDNAWRGENEWPLTRTRYTPMYIHSSGKANSLVGDGQLSFEPPLDEPEDHFVFDPNNPVPTMGGNHILPLYYHRGPVDQTILEQRFDVLVYSGDILEQDVEVTGPLSVKLFAASSAPDTDFTAKLVDVHPDGRAFNIADGIIRARYRKGRAAEPSLITPNSVVAYDIDLLATSIVFKKGHRIRIEISSSNFPRWDRNPNTGELAHEAETLTTAFQTVYHNSRYQTHILLPLIPR
ncbi:MAG: CocE/NonD family hydrolase [Deltaproteobacteria bacterium]|nr:CocE/NonD family hydrolase [Deltaproteobacteria bacterium]